MADKPQQQQQLRRIGDIVPAHTVASTVYSPDQLVNRELVLVGFEFKAGQYSDYVAMHCVDPRTREELVVNTGMEVIKAQLGVFPADALPAAFRFQPWGKQYKMV